MAVFSRKGSGIFKKRLFCSAVIVAAGESRRMDGGDKLFLEINGAPVLAHTLMAFQKCACIDEIVVVVREEELARVSGICGKLGVDKAVRIMTGGPTRQVSVLNGLLAVSKKAKYVAIHDGARPCVSVDIIERTVAAAVKSHAAAPGLQVSSTLKRVDGGVIRETVDREGLYEVQTPQVFDVDLIKAALTNVTKKGLDVTDDCTAVELLGVGVFITEGSARNLKITEKDDLTIAEVLLRQRLVV